MLETVILVVLVLWLLGAFVMPVALPVIAGIGVIHLLLVVVLVLLVLRLLKGRI